VFYYAHFVLRLPTARSGGGGSSSRSSSSSSVDPSSSSSSPWWAILLTFAALTHLYAGLFVTAHDAIHGAVCRSRRWVNDLLGAACITCYAFFSYRALHAEHWRHHHWTGRSRRRAEAAAEAEVVQAAPGGKQSCARQGEVGAGGGGNSNSLLHQQQQHHYDPDYPPNDDARLLPWFAAFMRHYSTPGQYLRTVAAVLAMMALGAPYANLCLFMAASAILAAFQLFYWGTYRPHRPDDAALRAHAKGGDPNAAVMPWPRARSAPYALPLLFLQAYFFNLHYEHHRWPSCPWWDLPRVRREARGVVMVAARAMREEGAAAY
jgi:beta-carotene/zeaxanthin 4-ketolase